MLHPSDGQSQPGPETINSLADGVFEQVVTWRRDIHQNPELGNREFRTAALVAEHLKGLGMDVTTGVAHTGVVGVMKGGRPGPTVLLRADMDALPVTERVDLPFASKVRAQYAGQEVGVMHACGHDTHVAILMGVADVLSRVREELPGTVKFVFQPAEEGPPPGEEGGADLMVRQGVLKNPDVDVAFGLHIDASLDAGLIGLRPGPVMASADDYKIVVRGQQAHGAYPWGSVDPVVTAAQIITSLQTIVSRNLNLLTEPGVVTVGIVKGGVRSNIIPEEVELIGTIRSLHPEMRQQIHQRVREIAENVAESMGATAEVQIPLTQSIPVLVNDPRLTDSMRSVLESVAGAENVIDGTKVTGYEDFSFFAREVPAVFLELGGKDPALPADQVAGHHTPEFRIDESGLGLGVSALAAMTVAYLQGDL